MPSAERVAVGRFQKPSELSIRCWPEHEIEHGLAGNFCPLFRKRPFRSGADHEFKRIGQGEGFFEHKIGAPLCVAAAKPRRDTRLDFEPIFYRSKFYGGCRTETRTAAGDTPFNRASDFNYRRRFPFFGL